MHRDEKIKVETESGQLIEVTVTSFHPDAIWILVGEGPHSSKCKLLPTGNGLAYAGSIMGRELIYPKDCQTGQGIVLGCKSGAQALSRPDRDPKTMILTCPSGRPVQD